MERKRCFIHPDVPSDGVCARCGREHCAECLVTRDGARLCRSCRNDLDGYKIDVIREGLPERQDREEDNRADLSKRFFAYVVDVSIALKMGVNTFT